MVVYFQLFGRPVDIRAGRFKADVVRGDEFQHETLFFGQRAAGLDALLGILQSGFHRFFAAAQTERGHHQTGVTEYGLRLQETLAFFKAD